MPYANRTKVPTGNTRNEIEKMLEKRGATSFVFGSAAGAALMMFELDGRRIKFAVPMPVVGRRVSDAQAAAETRRRWRAMLLVLKAKLEAVASSITTIDEEFLAHIVVDGKTNATVGDRVLPDMHAAIASGEPFAPMLALGDGKGSR